MYDEAFNGAEVRSTWGPQKMFSSWYGNLWDSMVKNTVAKLPSASVGFVDWLSDFGDQEWLGGSGQQEDVFDESDRFWSNASAAHQVKTPNDVAESGWADNARSFWWNAGGALGSIAQMILTRKASGSFGKMFGLSDEAASAFGAQMGSGTMAISAAESFDVSAREAGISEEMRLLLYGPALVGSFAVERWGGNILDDGLATFYTKRDLKSYVDDGIRKSVDKYGLTSASEMNKEQVKATGKKIWGRMLDESKGLANKTYDLTRRGADYVSKKTPTFIKAAWEEGAEEVMEGRLYTGLEMINDMYQVYDKHEGRNMDRYIYKPAEDGSGYYEVDKRSGQRRKITEETYNKGVEAQKVKPGQGMFGEYNPENGFLSNVGERMSEGIGADFFLGYFAGGVAGGFQQLNGGKRQKQDEVMENFVVNKRGAELRKEFEKMRIDGGFGPMDVTPEGTAHNPEDPESISMNQFGYETAMQELEAAEKLFESTGINDPAILEGMMTSKSGQNLLKEAYGNAGKQRDLQLEIDKFNQKISETTDQEQIARLQKQIDEKKILKQDLSLQLEDIRNGQRLKENHTDSYLERWSAEENTYMVGSDGSKYVPNGNQVKNFNDRYDTRRAAAIEAIKESKTRRAQLETKTGSFINDITNNKTDVKSSEQLNEFFTRLTDIQTTSSEVGMSEANATRLLRKLEDYRGQILEGVDQFFSEEQVAEEQGMAETTGDNYKESLLKDLQKQEEGSLGRNTYDTLNKLDKSINSFNVEQPGEVKVGDQVQWTSNDQNRFETPRTVKAIETDENGNKFVMVDGTDTAIPYSEVHDPAYNGREIKGSVPTEFNEANFKSQYYDNYIDTQGNEINISGTMEDLASRKMNDEDFQTLEFLKAGIKNNQYLASANKLLSKVGTEGQVDIGNFQPSKEAALSEDEYTRVDSELEQKKYQLKKLMIQQQKDSNDKKNREGKLRHDDYKIRSDIFGMVSRIKDLSPDTRDKLIDTVATLSTDLTEVMTNFDETGSYQRDMLDRIDPIIVEAESLIHKELNGKNAEAIIKDLGNQFKKYKKISKEAMESYLAANEFVMNDFDDSFSYDGFSAKRKDNLSSADKARDQFARVYFTNYLQTLKRVDSNEFYVQLSNVVDGIVEDDGILPSYEQIQVIHHAVGFLHDADNEILVAVESALTGLKPDHASHMSSRAYNRSLFIRGFAGTGKTSLVVKAATSIYSGILNKKLNIAVSAPSRSLQKTISSKLEGFRENTTEVGMSFEELTDYVNNKDSNIENIEVIVVDEASSISRIELDAFFDGLKGLKNRKRNLKVLFLGDQSQMTSIHQSKSDVLLPVERSMERTMPTTEVFRSGSADISNLQTAFRNSIFRNKKAILPKGTYDKEKNNGLEYFGGSKQDMYDSFVEDINNGDQFKKNNTVLIVYNNLDREAALNYIQKRVEDPNLDISSKVMTIEKGEGYVQGLEFPRIMVAINEADADHLYNKAVLTAATRAMKKDNDHQGYALVQSQTGYSEEGVPVVVETTTATDEDVSRMRGWLNGILGESPTRDAQAKTDSKAKSKEVTAESFEKFKANLKSVVAKGKIQFSNAKFIIDGALYRYKIKDKGVYSVTERLNKVIEKSSSESEFLNQAHAHRGSATHAIVESFLEAQSKGPNGKLFTKKAIETIRNYVNMYNSEVADWNENHASSESSMLTEIDILTDELVFETNPFVKSILENVAGPIAQRLNGGGKYSLPETILGIYFNDIAGTIDIIDQVGIEGGIPLVDILDLKTLTPGSHRFFDASNEESNIDLGVIKMPSGEVLPANKQNTALSQLGTYKAMGEQGDPETGLMPFKVRNVVIIKAALNQDNEADMLDESDFITYDSNSAEFDVYRQYGEDTVGLNTIPVESDRRVYDENHELLGTVHVQDSDNIEDFSTVEVTGVFSTTKGMFVEFNNIKDNPMTMDQFEEMFSEDNKGTAVNPNQNLDDKSVYKRSALKFSAGFSFAFGSASNFVQDGENPRTSDHAKFKEAFYKQESSKLNAGSPAAPDVDITYHPSFELVNDAGALEVFDNVLLVTASEKSLQNMVKVARKLDWGRGKSNPQIIKAIKEKGYDILGTLPNPDSDFNVSEKDTDFSNNVEVETLINKIKSGFIIDGVADQYKPDLVAWHTHLAGLRAMGAKTPGVPVGTVKLKGIEPGVVKYDGTERTWTELKDKLTKKGFKISKPMWSTNHEQKENGDGTITQIATWVADVWKVGRKTDKSTIILRAPNLDDDYMGSMRSELKEMKSNKATSFRDINLSQAFKFINQNRSFLIDPATGNFSSELDGLKDFLAIKNKAEISVNVKGEKKTPNRVMSSLDAALAYIQDAKVKGNNVANSLRQNIDFTTGDNKQLIVPVDQEVRLKTSASNVNNYSLSIDTKSIDDSSITNTKNGIAEDGDTKNPNLGLMGRFNMDPNNRTEKADIDEDTYDYDDQYASEDVEVYGDDSYFKYAMNFFGTTFLMNQVKKDVARMSIHFSNWNRDLKSPNYGIGDMVTEVMNFYESLLTEIPTHLNESPGRTIKDLAEVSGRNVSQLNEDEFGRYVYYTLGTNRDLLESVIQKIFPSIDMKNMKARDIGDYVSGKIEGNEDVKNLNDQSQANVMDNLNERDYTDTLSQFVKLHLDNTPLTTFEAVQNEDGTVSLKGTTSNFRTVDANTIHKTLTDAAQMGHWITEDTFGLNKIERLGHYFKWMADQAGIGTATYDNVMTIYNDFFSDERENMSHKFIRDNSIAYSGTGKSDLEIMGYSPSSIKAKGEASDNLLSALFSHFGSVASKSSADAEIKTLVSKDLDGSKIYRKKYSQKISSLAVGTHIAQSIKSRINSKLFGMGEGGLVVSERITKMISGAVATYNITAGGIAFKDGKQLVKFTKGKGRDIAKFEIPSNVTVDEIKGMFNVFDLKELVYNKTISTYLSKESDDNENPDKRIDRDKLAEIVGMMMLTARTSVDPNFFAKDLVERYFEKNGYERESLEGLNDDAAIDASAAGTDLYKPSELYRLIENLSKLQSDVQLNNNSRHYYSVDGKKIFRDTNGNTISMMFPSGSISGFKPSSGIKGYMQDLINEGKLDPEVAAKLLDNPLFYSNDGQSIQVLNRILDPKSGWDIEDVSSMGGMKSENNAARQGKGMTDRDFADMVFNAFFIEDLNSQKKIQTVKIPYHNTADKGQLPLFTHKFSDKHEIKKTEQGYAMNQDFINDNVVNIFHYHNNARLKSVDRISEVLKNGVFVNAAGQQVQLRLNDKMVEGFKENPATLQAQLNDLQASQGVVNMAEVFLRSDLMLTRDYKINKNGSLSPGKAPLMNVDNTYNWKNMQRMKESEDLTETISSIFFQKNMNAAKLMKDLGVKMHPSIKNKKFIYPTTEKGSKDPVWNVNKTVEAFLYSYHFSDHYLTQAIQGDVTQYKSIDDLFKRSTAPVASGWNPDTDSPRGMGKTSNVVILDDIEGEGYEQLASIFEKDGSYEDTDGLGFINPISYILMRNSFGGKDLGVIGDGMAKPVYFKNDLMTNDATYFKYASLNLSQQTLKNSAIARDVFSKMVGPDLYSKWESGMTFEELAEDVIQSGTKDQLIDQAIFASATKTGQKSVQGFDDAAWETSVVMDNEYFRIQLNASQDVENTDISQPTQLLAEMASGVHNTGRVDEINKIKAELADDGIDSILKKFANDKGIFDKEKFFTFLRDMGIESALKVGDIAQYAEMLHDKDINLNLPSLGKVKQQLINRVSSEAIKPKWNGVRMSQAPAFMFKLYEDETGKTFMENEIAKHGITSVKERSLKPMEFYDDAGNLIQSADEFNILLEQGRVIVKPAEVIVPFSYFKQFGLDKYVAEDPDFSFNDVFMIKSADGMTRSLKGLSEDDVVLELQSAFAKPTEEGEEVVAETFLQREFSGPDAALSFLKNFTEASKILNNRVPTSSTSGAFIADVVGWINDNGNTVYTSAAKNILDGGDYDIDQLNVFFKSIDKNGKINVDGKKGKMNQMFDESYGYYEDPRNAEIYMSPIDLGSDKEGQERGLRGQVASLKKNMRSFVNDHNDFGSTLFFYDNIHQGSNLIGVFANVIKNYSYLVQATAMNPDIQQSIQLDPNGYAPNGELIIDNMESYMNAATDNAKELILGLLGATEDAGNIIGAAAIQGMDKMEIAALLQEEAVQDIFKKMKFSKRVDNKLRLNIFDAIDNKIESLNTNAKAERVELEDKRNALIASISDPDSIQVESVQFEDDGTPIFLSNSQINSIVTDIINDSQNEIDRIADILNDMDPWIQQQTESLEKMLGLAYLGEAVNRLNTVTKLDSQGIPVFDYKLEKQIRDIEYNMGQSMSDFLTNKPVSAEWYKTRKSYMDPSKVAKFEEREAAIRDYINIPQVINQLPHIKAYVRAMNETKGWIENSFIRNSKMVKNAITKFLQAKKLDWFPSEQAYYSFYKELDKFMVSTYFSTKIGSIKHQTLTGTTVADKVNLGTRGGRYRFGMEFPKYISNMIDELKAKRTDLSDREALIEKNVFLNELTTRSTSTGDFLEFKDSYKLTPEKLADLREAFSRLPGRMKEKFYAYQLSKDGFDFKKGSLYEGMDHNLFRSYSDFLEKMEVISDAYDLGDKNKKVNMTDENGDQREMTFDNMMDVFLSEVGYYSDDMVLLKRENPMWDKNPNLIPDQYKVPVTKGDFEVLMVKERDTNKIIQGKSSKNFNPYSPTNESLTDEQVIKKFGSYENFEKAMNKLPFTVTFNGRFSFKTDPIYLPDGTLAVVTRKTGDSITISPYDGTDKMASYQNTREKRELLSKIAKNSDNEMHRELSTFLLNSEKGSYLNVGVVNFTNETNDPAFYEAANPLDPNTKPRKVLGYYHDGTMNISLNMDRISDENKFEKVYLHEQMHNFINYALNMSDEQISNLNASQRAMIDDAIRFRADANKIFAQAKKAAKAEDLKMYGFTNVHEFVTEAFTNPKLQAFLAQIDGVEELQTENWLSSAWNQFLNAIKRLLGLNTPNSYSALDQIIGVTNRFIVNGGYRMPDIGVIKKGENSGYQIHYYAEEEIVVPEIKDSKDIINSIQPMGVMKNYSQYRQEELINAIYANIDTRTESYYYNGEKFYFKNLDELQKKAKIKKEIVPLYSEFEKNYKDSVIGWLNTGAEEQGESPANFFPKKGGESRYNKNVLASIKKKIDWDKNDVYMKYSEFKDQNGPIPFLEDFEGYDPIITIHKSFDESQESISIFDMTSLRLSKKSVLEGNIFKNFLSNDRDAIRRGVTLGGNEGDMRRLLLGLQAMAMKQANPDLKIKSIAALGINSKGVDSAYVNMQDFVNNVKVMGEIEPIYNALPQSLKDIVDDKALYQYEDYHQPWLFTLKRTFQERALDLRADKSQSFNYKKTSDTIDKMESYLNGEGGKEDIIEAVKYRMEQIQEKLSEEEVFASSEYKYLSATLEEMTSTPLMEKTTTKDLNKFKSWWTPTHNIEHRIINWAQEKINDSIAYVTEVVGNWQVKEFTPLLKTFNERYFSKNPNDRFLDYVQNLSGKKFAPLFKSRTVKDLKGADVEINSMEIHWDKDDAETKALINSGKIAPGDVELAKFVVDTIEEQMILNIMHNNRHNLKYKRKDAEKELSQKWRKGMIPAMSSSVNEMLMKKDPKSVKAAYNKFFSQLSNQDDFYDEAGVQRKEDTKRQRILKDMGDVFTNQIGKDSDIYGSNGRMDVMGLKSDAVGAPILVDANKNKNLSMNLELTTLYMVSSSERKRKFERDVLPVVNAAQAMMQSAETIKLEGSQKNAISYFTSYVNSVIRGQAETIDSKIAGIELDPAINIALQITSATSLGLNIGLGLTSGLMNAGQFMNSSIANDVAMNGLYTRKDAARALKSFATKAGRDKIEGLMEMYKIADRSERDITHNPRRKVTNKNIFNSHTMHWTNWVSDYHIRGIVMMSQMIHDGSDKAYTMVGGELRYNESKDPRWQSPDGKSLKKFIKERLVEQGFMQNVDDKMPRGYENKESLQLKYIADKYIVGSMDSTTQTRLSRATLGRPFMQYRSFLPDKVHNYFGSEKYSPIEGQWKQVMTKDGPTTVWAQNQIGGMLESMKNLAVEIRKNKYSSKKAWEEMSVKDKRNVARFGADMFMYTMLSLIYGGLVMRDWDDEKEGDQTLLPDSRFMRVFKYAAMDYLMWSPTELVRGLTGIPLLEQAERYANVLIGNFDEVDRILPLAASVKAIKEVIPEGEEE